MKITQSIEQFDDYVKKMLRLDEMSMNFCIFGHEIRK